MIKAVKLTERAMDTITAHTKIPESDLQALYEHVVEEKTSAYVLIRWEVGLDVYPWRLMDASKFHSQYELSTWNQPYRFVPVVNK